MRFTQQMTVQMKSLLILGLLANQSFAASFENINEFTAVELGGYLHVSCPSEVAKVPCMSGTYEPKAEAYLTEAEAIDADQVALTIETPEGSRTQTLRYLADKKRTQKKINLIYNTLWNERFLKPGVNQVDYVFTKNGQVVRKGRFEVKASIESRECRAGGRFGSDNSVCRNASAYCEEYFWRENFCRY